MLCGVNLPRWCYLSRIRLVLLIAHYLHQITVDDLVLYSAWNQVNNLVLIWLLNLCIDEIRQSCGWNLKQDIRVLTVLEFSILRSLVVVWHKVLYLSLCTMPISNLFGTSTCLVGLYQSVHVEVWLACLS